MTDLGKMLPFLKEEELKELTKRIMASEDGTWKGICVQRVLPFLDAETVENLCRNAMEKGQNYNIYFPFLSGEAMHGIVTEVTEGKLAIALDAMYPFLDEEDIRKVFYFYLEKEE